MLQGVIPSALTYINTSERAVTKAIVLFASNDIGVFI